MAPGGSEGARSPAWVAVAVASVASRVPVTTVGRVVATSRFSVGGPFGGVFLFLLLSHWPQALQAPSPGHAQDSAPGTGRGAGGQLRAVERVRVCTGPLAQEAGRHTSPPRRPATTPAAPLRNSVAQVCKICY